MSGSGQQATSHARWWWIGGAAAAVVLVVVLALTLGRGSADDGLPSSQATPTGSASADPSSSAEPSPSDEPTVEPVVVPTEPVEVDLAVTVPVPPVGDLPPVQVPGDQTATTGGVEVAVRDVRSVTTAGKGQGEFAGPGVDVTIELRNTGKTAFDTSTVTVTVYAGEEGIPLSPVETDPANVPVSGVIEPGGSAAGRYVFVAPEDGAVMAVSVELAPGVPYAVFQGLTTS